MEATLTKYSNPALTDNLPVSLTTSETEIVRISCEGQKLKDFAPDAMLRFVANLMFNAKLRLNHSTGFGDEVAMQKMISLDLKKNFGGLTDEEVKKAMSMGLNGDFVKKPDEVVVFSPASLIKWIKAYVTTQKQPAMAKYIAYTKANDTDAPPSLDEQLKGFKAALLWHYGRIKESLKIDESGRQQVDYYEFDFGNAFYDRLEWLGLIYVEKDKKWTIYQEEKERLKINPEIKDKTEKLVYQDWIRHLSEQGADVSNPFEVRLKNMCKRRILRELVFDWIDAGVNLEEILDNAIKAKL